ncbi:tyrosine-type recombinase/integrase, partial [Sphingobium sp.]|uniref:tyrosine-type recombinase/integrase n=1 Tax=Sphingobium sp. TaxID=1912891 RepID=UPI0028BD2606
MEQTDDPGHAAIGTDQAGKDDQAVSAGAAEPDIAALAIEEANLPVGIGPFAALALAVDTRPVPLVLPAPGQRWAYGARKHYVAQRRAERAAEQARTPLQRFEAALVYLPTTGRPAIRLDLVEATLAAMAPNTVRGLLADMAGFGEACRRCGVSALPAQPTSVIAFLKARAAGEGGLARAKPATLSRILWAIATFHRLFDLPDPTKDRLVALTLKGLRRELGTAQRQARPLRYKGSVSDVFEGDARGMSLKALLDGCPSDEKGLRDRALLSVAYDTGLRASELVAIDIAHIRPSSDPDTRLLHIPRHKGDQEGEGATAFLSMRSVLALKAWIAVMAEMRDLPEITEGPLFRRLFIKPLKEIDPAVARAAARQRAPAT